MIYLTTGGNGAGKTLFTLHDVREQQLKENRPVYYHGFTAKPILKEWGWQEFDPKKWQDLPDGSICIFDECQNEFPAKVQGELPDYINAVAQFRRKRGFDFWMITPHPSLIHVNIRRLVEAPSWHRHMKRNFGGNMVSQLKFNFVEMKCELPGAGARGQVSLRPFPKEVYDWYESASLHTGKRKLPKQVWLLAACALLVPTLGYLAYRQFTGAVMKPEVTQAAKKSDVKPLSAPMNAASQHVSVSEYLELRKPRLPDFPHTAPAYDEVTKPVVAPYPAACVQDAKRCNCYTQQGTLLRTSGEVCQQIVKYGYFVDWDDGRYKQDMQQGSMRMQGYQSPSFVQQQPYQRQASPATPEALGWEERMQARNAAVVSNLKR